VQIVGLIIYVLVLIICECAIVARKMCSIEEVKQTMAYARHAVGWGVEVEIHLVLTSVLCECEWPK